MNILVIGAGGFLGSRLISKIQGEDVNVYGAVRSLPLNKQEGCSYILTTDSTIYAKASQLKFDVIINVAMKRSSRNGAISDLTIQELNYEVPLKIIEQFATIETLVINTSTYIQNFLGVKGKTTEGYSFSKELLSTALESRAKNGLFRVLDLYLFTLFGPGDKATHLVPLLIHTAKEKRRIQLSEGNQLINLLYVDDAVASIIGAIGIPFDGYKPYFLWQEKYLTVRSLVPVIESVLGCGIDVEWGALPYSGHEMFEPWTIPMAQFPKLIVNNSLHEGILKSWTPF
jgi:nucleoside-diphosphate-sugar epimerase